MRLAALSIRSVTPATDARETESYATPFGEIGRFRSCRLLANSTMMSRMLCSPFVKFGEYAMPSFAVLAVASGALKRSSYCSPVM